MKSPTLRWWLLLTWLTVACPTGLSAFVCSDNYCSRVVCNNITSCVNGYVMPKGDLCGCCDLCVTYLSENEPCWHLFVLNGSPRTTVCAPGLVCDETTKVCSRDKNGKNGSIVTSAEIPPHTAVKSVEHEQEQLDQKEEQRAKDEEPVVPPRLEQQNHDAEQKKEDEDSKESLEEVD